MRFMILLLWLENSVMGRGDFANHEESLHGQCTHHNLKHLILSQL